MVVGQVAGYPRGTREVLLQLAQQIPAAIRYPKAVASYFSTFIVDYHRLFAAKKGITVRDLLTSPYRPGRSCGGD